MIIIITYLVSILGSCMFSLSISIYHSKFHNFSQVAYCEFSDLLLIIGICCIYLIAFILSLLWTLNNMQSDVTHNFQLNWHMNGTFQNGQASAYNLHFFSLQFPDSEVTDSQSLCSCECASCLKSCWTTECSEN